MTPNLDIEPRWRELVSALPRDHAPRPCRIWAFGSRVRGEGRRFSDLDLAMDAGRQLAFRDTTDLAEAFEESPLPWRTDRTEALLDVGLRGVFLDDGGFHLETLGHGEVDPVLPDVHLAFGRIPRRHSFRIYEFLIDQKVFVTRKVDASPWCARA